MIGGYTDRSTDSPLVRQSLHRKWHILLLLLHVFIAMGMCLTSRCLAPKGGTHLTEPLLSNDRRDKYTDTQTAGRDL
jgi:hypothetical protein